MCEEQNCTNKESKMAVCAICRKRVCFVHRFAVNGKMYCKKHDPVK